MRERVARAMCVAGGFDPNEIMSNDGPRWEYYVESADAAIATILAELETPSVEMCRAAIVAWDNTAVKSDEVGMAAALQAAAAHLRKA